MSPSSGGCRTRTCRVRDASGGIWCAARTRATRAPSTAARTGPTVSTRSRRALPAAEDCRSRRRGDSAAVTAASRSRRVPTVAAGCGPGRASTAAFWAARTGPRASTPETLHDASGVVGGRLALRLGADWADLFVNATHADEMAGPVRRLLTKASSWKYEQEWRQPPELKNTVGTGRKPRWPLDQPPSSPQRSRNVQLSRLGNCSRLIWMRKQRPVKGSRDRR